MGMMCQYSVISGFILTESMQIDAINSMQLCIFLSQAKHMLPDGEIKDERSYV